MRAENGTAANRALDGGTHRGATQTSTRTTRPRLSSSHACATHAPCRATSLPRLSSSHPKARALRLSASRLFYILLSLTCSDLATPQRTIETAASNTTTASGTWRSIVRFIVRRCKRYGTLPGNLRFHKGLVQYSVRNQPFFSLWDAYSTVSSLSQILAKNPSVHWFRTHNLMPQRACLNRSKCFS